MQAKDKRIQELQDANAELTDRVHDAETRADTNTALADRQRRTCETLQASLDKEAKLRAEEATAAQHAQSVAEDAMHRHEARIQELEASLAEARSTVSRIQDGASQAERATQVAVKARTRSESLVENLKRNVRATGGHVVWCGVSTRAKHASPHHMGVFAQVEASEEQLAELKQEAQQAHAATAASQRDVARLEGQVAALRHAHDDTSQRLVAAEDRIAELRVHHAALHVGLCTRIDPAFALCVWLCVVVAVSVCLCVVDVPQSQLSDTKQAHHTTLRELERERDSSQQLEEQLTAAQADAATAQSQLSAATAMQADLRAALDDTADELHAAQDAAQQATSALSTARRDLAAAAQERDAAVDEAAALQKRVAGLSDDLHRAEATERRLRSRLTAEGQGVDQVRAELEEELAVTAALREQLKSVEVDRDALRREKGRAEVRPLALAQPGCVCGAVVTLSWGSLLLCVDVECGCVVVAVRHTTGGAQAGAGAAAIKRGRTAHRSAASCGRSASTTCRNVRAAASRGGSRPIQGAGGGT